MRAVSPLPSYVLPPAAVLIGSPLPSAAEFYFFRHAPNKLRMLQSSFGIFRSLATRIWEMSKQVYRTLSISMPFVGIGIFALIMPAAAITRFFGGDGLVSFVGSMGGWLIFGGYLMAILFGISLAIVNWYKLPSQENTTDETHLAARLVRVARAEQLSPILKLVDDKLDRVKAILDRVTLITAAAGLLSLLHLDSHGSQQYVAFAAGCVVILVQIYRATQTRILRMAKTVCLMAQCVLESGGVDRSTASSQSVEG
jgi:hypothetical protein